jgi:hypothetical protein
MKMDKERLFVVNFMIWGIIVDCAIRFDRINNQEGIRGDGVCCLLG